MNEKVKNYTAEECEKRISEIKTEMLAEDANLEELSAEVDAINQRKQELVNAEEQRKALAGKVADSMTGTEIESRKEDKMA